MKTEDIYYKKSNGRYIPVGVGVENRVDVIREGIWLVRKNRYMNSMSNLEYYANRLFELSYIGSIEEPIDYEHVSKVLLLSDDISCDVYEVMKRVDEISKEKSLSCYDISLMLSDMLIKKFKNVNCNEKYNENKD